MKAEIKQEIKIIPVSDLHLWTENPRDPIDLEMNDLEIIKRAIKDDRKKWNLTNLIKEMGGHYDFSELPTVVYENKKYILYDGNRRIAIIKYLQNPEWDSQIEGKLIPSSSEDFKNLSEVPCNVCDKKTALKNIERKHIFNGSWKQLERDYFTYKHLEKGKSLFIKFEEATGLISANPNLNENIMKNNILTDNKLKDIGFSFDDQDNLVSVYDEKTAREILDKIVELKKEGIIGSRGDDKYQIKIHLDRDLKFKGKIKKFDKDSSNLVNYLRDKKDLVSEKKTRRQNAIKNVFFGGELHLKKSITNDLYLDILELYKFYCKNKNRLSSTFPNLIRMSLRLLIDSAKKTQKDDLDVYIKSNFVSAKTKLNKDQKTTIDSNNVKEGNLASLLHIGAHNYSTSSNLEQTIAISIIIGEMLKITHKK